MSFKPTLSDEYLAGLFDGEGCISISQKVENRNKFSTKADVSMTDKEVVYKLKEELGGSIHIQYRTRGGKKLRPLYSWQLTGFMLTVFLTKIQPYVIVKKLQVEAALALRKLLENYHSNKGLTKKQLEKRYELKKIVQSNNYGKYNQTN